MSSYQRRSMHFLHLLRNTPWLNHGDTVHIAAQGRDGQSVVGAIDQDVLMGAQPPTPRD